MASYSLEMEPERYFTGYDTNINPGVANSVATAALYFYISLMPKELGVYNEVRTQRFQESTTYETY